MRAVKVSQVLSILAEEQRIGEINDSLTKIILCVKAQEEELSDEELFLVAAAKAQKTKDPSAKPNEKEKF